MPCGCNQTAARQQNDFAYTQMPGEYYSDERMANQNLYVPGACDQLDTGALLIGGLIIGSLGALFMVNLTGETSLFGMGRKIKHAGSHTYHSARNVVNKR